MNPDRMLEHLNAKFEVVWISAPRILVELHQLRNCEITISSCTQIPRRNSLLRIGRNA